MSDLDEKPRISTEARVKLWMFLGTALVLAVAALLGVMATRDGADEAAVDEGVVVRLSVTDEGGAPVPQAALFVQTPVDAPTQHRGRWSSEHAVLTVPKAATPVSISIQARGFRSDIVENLAEDRTFVLRMGLLVKLKPEGELEPIRSGYRLVFQLNPAPRDPAALSAEQREAFVELIDTRTPAPEGRLVLPRVGFGFAVWASVAADGILLPLPGRYAVRWGLLDPQERVWFSLKDITTATIRVQDDERTQVFEIPIPAAEIEQTVKGLAERVRGLETD